MDVWTIIAIALGVILSLSLVMMYRMKKIDKETLDKITELINTILKNNAGGDVSRKIEIYAETAVNAVEQLVKSGQLDGSNESRKSAALEMIRESAKVDGIELGESEVAVAESCIESEVHYQHKG